MIRRRRLRPRAEDDVNLTPMLDVTFIMLIFFIVTASFVKESGIDVNRAPAASAVPQERATVLVGIAESGQVWIDGRPVDVRAVRAHLERLHAENPKGTVVIQADRRAESGVLVQVLDATRLAGVDDVAVAAETP